MKGLLVSLFVVMTASFFWTDPALCQDMSNEEIIQELRALKERIDVLEQELTKKDREIDRLKAETLKRQEMHHVIDEMKSEGGPLEALKDRVRIGGLIELGGAWEGVNNRDGTDADQSDINLTTVALAVEADINEWVSAEATLLYEDPTFGIDTSVELDTGIVVIGNAERFPFYFTGGKMYVPFGALLTHFPDDPLIDQPLALLLGETNEAAALVGVEHRGFSVSGYVFNGDMIETGKDNEMDSFGIDGHYEWSGEKGLELLIGASYISNIADSDGLTALLLISGVDSIRDHVGGFDAYVHIGYAGWFFDAEYMSATENFQANELATETGAGAKPAVWNLEAGYNWNWGKNLEIGLKYAGSDETENLGFPEDRYGLVLNQTIFESVIASLAFLHDEFHRSDSRDDRNVLFGQIALVF
jgi:hypothetical protein